MKPNTPHSDRPGRLQRVLAGWLAALVFALSLLAFAPSLHARLHDHAHDHDATAVSHDDAGCAVTLFQQGVTTPLSLPSLGKPAPATRLLVLRAPDAVPLSAAPQRLRPVRGPPRVG